VSVDPKRIGDPGPLTVLMNVPLHLTAELGRRQMLVSEVLGLGAGSIVELDRLAGDPVDVLIAGRLIARGEIVAVAENFGVRITELVGRTK
jgi:flagellar motor switch protein FliN/FliY